MKNELSIQLTSASADCETCGYCWSDGAIVLLDGVELLELEPVASCLYPIHWTPEDVYREILLKLGYTIKDFPNSIVIDGLGDYDPNQESDLDKEGRRQ